LPTPQNYTILSSNNASEPSFYDLTLEDDSTASIHSNSKQDSDSTAMASSSAMNISPGTYSDDDSSSPAVVRGYDWIFSSDSDEDSTMDTQSVTTNSKRYPSSSDSENTIWPNCPYYLEGRYGFVSIDKNSSTSEFARYIPSINTPRRTRPSCLRRAHTETGDCFVIDTGGGRRPTITTRAWKVVGGEPGLTATFTPYQLQQRHEYPVVSAVTKATVSNISNPIIFKVHYATLISDDNELESLCTTMDLGAHGVQIEGIHPHANTRCGLTVNNKFMEFDWDNESIFFQISKPTEEELETYDIFELNSPLPNTDRVRRVKETN